MDLKINLLIYTICCCSISGILGTCIVQLPKDEALRPTFQRKIGSRIAVLSNEDQFIEVQENHEITAICGTRFQKPSGANGQSTIQLKCINNRFSGYNNYNSLETDCDSLKWNLYESSAPFRWCPTSTVSYIIARPSAGTKYVYLAGVCYNFEEMEVVSLHYAMAPKISQHMYPTRLQNYTPAMEIQNIQLNFVTPNITVSRYDNSKFQEWIAFSNYQKHSLIQNSKLYRESYDKFGGLLDFGWWAGLRLGNWRIYEEALSQHIQSDRHEYDILAGVSGTVSVPIFEKDCQENRTLVKLIDRSNRKIPLYVWHYLKSTTADNSSDLVVIGFNSPFYDFHDKDDIVFCKDICHKIDWLQKFHSTFRYNVMGTIFCCSVDEVKISRRLYGFPLPPKTITIAQTPPPPLPILRAKAVYDDLEGPPPIEIQAEDSTISRISKGNDFKK